ncbi:MAG: hypothetical protein FJX77_10095 [Armatimonadetes bacterium]|nr:hypothetical protein [Armatimonadota bacterium]
MRTCLARILVLALTLAGLAPVPGGWICPNGTRCVQEGQAFYCASGGRADGCCTRQTRRACRHGEYAGPGQSGTAPRLHDADHCRFVLLAAADEPGRVGDWFLIHLPDGEAASAPAAPLAAVVSIRQGCRPGEGRPCRPPPLLPGGPCRAPPLS